LMLSLIPVHQRTQLNLIKMITFIIFLKIAYLGREKSLSKSETNQSILSMSCPALRTAANKNSSCGSQFNLLCSAHPSPNFFQVMKRAELGTSKCRK